MRFARMEGGAVAEIIANGKHTTISGQIIPWRYMRGWQAVPDQRGELTSRNLTLIGEPEPPTTQPWQTAKLVRCAVGDAEPADRWEVETLSLTTYKSIAKARISAEAEAEREKYLTPGSGKALSYQKVKEEAERYVAMNGEGAYPFLQARVDSGRYPDLAAAAAGTLAIEGQWTVAGAAIDRKEDTAKLAIDAAANHAAVDAVRVTW
jgi:hypothetical protein